MNYIDRFALVEYYLAHLDPVMASIGDPFVKSRYLGFIAVSAVTTYELAIKDIFYAFADKKHVILGEFARARFDQLNGRIKLSSLRNEHVKMFGERYVLKFNKKLEQCEQLSITAGRGSPMSSWGNIITWRHTFVHQGVAPNTTTYQEIKNTYDIGKEVVHCLNAAMCR
jgi:hypothetical protein